MATSGDLNWPKPGTFSWPRTPCWLRHSPSTSAVLRVGAWRARPEPPRSGLFSGRSDPPSNSKPVTSGWPTDKERSSPPSPPSPSNESATPQSDTSTRRPDRSTAYALLSFTHAVAGPTVGRTLAEQGADVLGVAGPNDYEHDFIYTEANIGSRTAYEAPWARSAIGRAQILL